MNRTELLIESDELAAMIDDPDLRLFDSTVLLGSNGDARETYLAQHIPGAAFLDHQSLSDPAAEVMFMIPPERELAAAIGQLGISNEARVVFYSTGELCWATRAWWVLRYAGHRNVRVLNGGISAWHGEMQSGENAYPEATFSTSLSPGMFASIEEVEAALKDHDTCVVNALFNGIYTGEMATPYSGHIPGSLNHPMHDFMAGQYLRSDEELSKLFGEKLQQPRLITYCGGGVAATVNASAALLAGIGSVAVYDGSMSEWIHRDKAVATGDNAGQQDHHVE